MVHKVNVVLTLGEGRRARRPATGFVPHARQREVKTDAIVEAALRVLMDDGLDAVTLQRVARELGLTTTALYRYFPSKDALLAALQRQAVTEIHREIGTVLGALDPALRRRSAVVAAMARLLAVARFYLELPRSHPQTYHLVAVLLGDPRPLIADADAVAAVPLLAAVLGDVGALFEMVAAEGGLEPGDAMPRALALWALLNGINQLEKLARVAPQPPDRTALGRLAVEALLRGFGADPAVLARAQAAFAPGGSQRSRT